MLPTDWRFALILLARLCVAALFGGLIGLERQKARRNAGLRTHILISLGSALVMCTGEAVFQMYSGISNVDPARLGAQVVSGIGVLCAGTIMKAGSSVRGLTTATGLWCAACIGLAVGSGNVIPAAGATVIVVVVLWLFRRLEERRMQKHTSTDFKIRLYRTDDAVSKIAKWFEENHYHIETLSFEHERDDTTLVFCNIALSKAQSCTQLSLALSALDYVQSSEPLVD